MIRKPAVAGYFYPREKEALQKAVLKYLKHPVQSKNILGLGAPHAGYIYSGATAGHTYASVILPKKYIILGPSHTGMGAEVAIMTNGEWETPLGNVPIDSDLAQKLMTHSNLFTEDSEAHSREHSLEVQLPFLKSKRPDFSFVPVCIQYIPFKECEALGQSIARVIQKSGEDILMIASTDMNHHENQETTIKKDNLAIQKILALDPEGLYRTCEDNGITMCGMIPTTVMLVACKEIGAISAELVEHTTSGEAAGDYNSVVGYAGFLIKGKDVG